MAARVGRVAAPPERAPMGIVERPTPMLVVTDSSRRAAMYRALYEPAEQLADCGPAPAVKPPRAPMEIFAPVDPLVGLPEWVERCRGERAFTVTVTTNEFGRKESMTLDEFEARLARLRLDAEELGNAAVRVRSAVFGGSIASAMAVAVYLLQQWLA